MSTQHTGLPACDAAIRERRSKNSLRPNGLCRGTRNMPWLPAAERGSMERRLVGRRRSYSFPSPFHEQLSESGARYQRQFPRLGNGRTLSQDSKILPLDRVQNFLAAAAKEFEVDGEFPVDFFYERQTAMEPLTRALNLRLHHLAEDLRVAVVSDVFFAHTESAKALDRQVNAAFGVVDAHVLPEICQLQRGAGEIGKLLAFGVTVAAEVEHKMAYWVGRITAVSEQIIKASVARDGLVLTEGTQQVREFVLGNFERFNCFRQRDKDRMLGIPVIAGIQFGFPLVEQSQRGPSVSDFVTQIIGDAAVGVDIAEVLAQAARKKPGGDGKILVMAARQTAAVFAGLRGRWCASGDRVVGREATPAERGSGCGRDWGVGVGHAIHSLRAPRRPP